VEGDYGRKGAAEAEDPGNFSKISRVSFVSKLYLVFGFLFT
jgi:hypothetical protein